MKRYMLLLAPALWMLCLASPVELDAQPSLWTATGTGGGGALFASSFSPHNANELYVACDMTQLFHSTDLGESWGVLDFRQLQVETPAAISSSPVILWFFILSTQAGMPERR